MCSSSPQSQSFGMNLYQQSEHEELDDFPAVHQFAIEFDRQGDVDWRAVEQKSWQQIKVGLEVVQVERSLEEKFRNFVEPMTRKLLNLRERTNKLKIRDLLELLHQHFDDKIRSISFENLARAERWGHHNFIAAAAGNCDDERQNHPIEIDEVFGWDVHKGVTVLLPHNCTQIRVARIAGVDYATLNDAAALKARYLRLSC